MAHGAGGTFEGEDSSSLLPEDAEHWVRVYTELLSFSELPQGDGPGSALDPTLPIHPMRGTAERYRRRLAYWCERLGRLKAVDQLARRTG